MSQRALENERIKLLMGTTGSGKTYALRELLDKEDRAFCFDLMGDEKLESWGVVVASLEDAIHLAQKTEKFRIRLQFADTQRFDFLCKCCVKKPHGFEVFRDVCIAVDELALFCSAHWMPESLANAVRLGRHTNTRLIATTQRPPDIHPLIRSQAKEWWIYQMHLPGDVDWLKKIIGEELAQKTLTLSVGEKIIWTPRRGTKS